MEMDLCNLSVIRSLMAEEGIAFRKEFGQNFLINPKVPERIAENCTDEADSMILEIGPGIGCLTKELAIRYAKVVAVEIDRGLIPILAKTLADYPNVTVLNQDVMKVDLPRLVQEYAGGKPVSVCANLPYYITTPILMYLLESGVRFSSITVMVQNEVADRLCAAAGDADYGQITAMIGYYGRVKRLFRVTAGSFTPAPKVDSAVVRIDLYEESPFTVRDFAFFQNIVRGAFEMRRKTLVNALSSKLSLPKDRIAAALAELGFSETVRGEKLSTKDFVDLSGLLL